VIPILIDTLRADRLGIYDYRRMATPNVDSFAYQGTVFDAIASQVSLILPSHTSLFSALLDRHLGLDQGFDFYDSLSVFPLKAPATRSPQGAAGRRPGGPGGAPVAHSKPLPAGFRLPAFFRSVRSCTQASSPPGLPDAAGCDAETEYLDRVNFQIS